MAIPVSESPYTFEQGKKYSIVLDFFSETGQGAGYVDPEEPGDLDGDEDADDDDKGKLDELEDEQTVYITEDKL